MNNVSDVVRLNKKLDTIISLIKISVSDKLDELSKEVRNDEVAKKILEMADGTLKYKELKDEVAKDVGVHEVTVRRRISYLAEKGLIIGRREGRDVYYLNAGIIE